VADRDHGIGDNGPGHAAHDPELVAGLLDDELTDNDRATAQALVATCDDCALIFDDLIALAAATRSQPTPARPRDFRLTEADAARLRPPAREPLVAPARLMDDMTDAQPASRHASHDTILVASLVDHSVVDRDRAAAEDLVASCGECAALHADLIALRTATRALPTPARPRDYQLTEADAARLRPGGWRRVVAAFGTTRDNFSRPLAIGLTTLGLAGLIVAGLPSLSMGGPTSLSTVGNAVPGVDRLSSDAARATDQAPEAAGAGQPPAAVPGDTGVYPVAGASAAAQPASSGWSVIDQGAGSSPEIQADGATVKGAAATDTGSGQTNPVQAIGEEGRPRTLADTGIPTLLLVSVTLLVAGLGLFALRWTARRFGA
jgi:hypothetical protein